MMQDTVGARLAAAGLAATRPVRDEGLMELSGLGLIGPELDVALACADRARFVQYAPASKKLKKLRLWKLELSDVIPPWIGELRHLRTLIGTTRGAKLPPSLAKLPHLRFLHLDGSSDLASLDGLERIAALETVTCGDTALDDAALAGYAKRVGAAPTQFITGLDFQRRVRKPPAAKQRLVAAINDDTLDDGSDLRERDLAGARFEAAYISHDLRGAKLAGTVWKSCDFEYAQLDGADLTNAIFHDCYFGDRTLGAIRAPGAVFLGCGGELALAGSTLTDAALLDMDPDFGLDLAKAKAQGLRLQGAFCSEKEHRWSTKGADLRRATVELDITAGRRAELKTKKTKRLAWKTTHLAGAKTDKTTRVVYASLDPVPRDPAPRAPATRPAEATVKPRGKAAPILGRIYAGNSSLWLVVADADVAEHWRGSVDENDKHDDFQRALASPDGGIDIGDREGVRVTVGHRSGWSHLFGTTERYKSLRLVDAALQGDDRAACDRGMALRMGQWPVWSMPKRVGKFYSTTGVIAVLVPYREGKFPPKLRAKATGGAAVIDRDHDRALVALASGPGTYEVVRYPFRPEKGRGPYEDELGEYGDVIEISYTDRLPARFR